MAASDPSEAEPTMTIGPWVVVLGIPPQREGQLAAGLLGRNPGDEDEPRRWSLAGPPRRGRGVPDGAGE